jgi:hypothetical protein
MATSTHIRVISLVLALTVVVGSWLLLEYNSRPTASGLKPMAPSAPSSTEPSPGLQSQPALTQPVPVSRDVNLTYKCRRNGRISFSDQPCAANEETLTVTASEKEFPVDNSRLARMKQVANQMEAERLQRERQVAVAIASRAESATPDRTSQCKEIDAGVAVIDSHLRQPHDGHTGDRLNAERKRLMDKRFELRC